MMPATLLDRVTALLNRRLAEIEIRESQYGRSVLGSGLSEEEAASSRELLGLAEHARKVERDKADLLLRVIGIRAQSLSPEQVRALVERYEADPMALLGEPQDAP